MANANLDSNITNSSVSLQNIGSKTGFNTSPQKGIGSAAGMSLRQRTAISSSLELNGEDFVILPISGKSPTFNNRANNNINNVQKAAPGSTRLVAYKAEKETSNEVHSAIASSFLGALFPMGGLLEAFSHVLEGVHKVSENASRKVTLSETQNINPNDSINPNKAFLPVSPFMIPAKPQMELWQQKRAASQETERKKKEKKKGLGSY